MLDYVFIFQWWLLLFFLGILFLPLTISLFHEFRDKGYIFSKIIGTLIVSYSMFIAGSIKLLPFSRESLLLIIFLFAAAEFIFLSKNKIHFVKQIRLLPKIIIAEEILFLCILAFWSIVRGYQPDIHGLEKFMDFGFVNSILRSTYFPPKDMWFTPFSINYYYFGHFATAVLTKLSGMSASITYNLMIATLCSFTFVCSFSIAANLLKDTFLPKKSGSKNTFFLVLAALVTSFFATFAGNLHTIYAFFSTYNTDTPQPFWKMVVALNSFPNGYWYPNATRFIHNTIHEFPMYSFIVSDLHGHVLSIPIVLTLVAFFLHIFLYSKKITKLRLQFIAFLLACAYMTNAWDGAIYLFFAIIVIAYIHFDLRHKFTFIPLLFSLLSIVVGFFVFSLPFSLFFQTASLVHGIGVLCAPKFLTNIGHIGPFLFEVDHCQKSPVWQLGILYGFFYFFAISFLVFFARNKLARKKVDIFIIMLICISTIVLIVPEFIYMKDIYPAHYRANTMFKLAYQAFIMMSIVTGYSIFRLLASIRKKLPVWTASITIIHILISLVLITLVSVYPYFAITSYYNNLQTYKGIDGMKYLQQLHPGDYEAIAWLNTHVQQQPVILEAQGDSYTDYARISANTGLPTVLGWTVHEWLWRGSYDVPSPRIAEIQTLYESTDIQATRKLLKKYNIALVYVGDLEREKYASINEKKFASLGKAIYKKDKTTIYSITAQ